MKVGVFRDVYGKQYDGEHNCEFVELRDKVVVVIEDSDNTAIRYTFSKFVDDLCKKFFVSKLSCMLDAGILDASVFAYYITQVAVYSEGVDGGNVETYVYTSFSQIVNKGTMFLDINGTVLAFKEYKTVKIRCDVNKMQNVKSVLIRLVSLC